MSGIEVSALQRALAAEQAIVWGYGVAGAHLTGEAAELATTAWQSHEQRRDALGAMVRARHVTPVAPAPAYQLPFRVYDRASALRLVEHLENAGAGAAWDLVEVSPPGSRERSLAVRWLTAAATDTARLAEVVPPALPGAPPDTGGGQSVGVTRNTGWSGAIRSRSSSVASGPTPPKN